MVLGGVYLNFVTLANLSNPFSSGHRHYNGPSSNLDDGSRAEDTDLSIEANSHEMT
jgi:hypothetical protein